MARIESTLVDQSNDIKELGRQLQSLTTAIMIKESAMKGMPDFAEINNRFPVDVLTSFQAIDLQITEDDEFHSLLVSFISDIFPTGNSNLTCHFFFHFDFIFSEKKRVEHFCGIKVGSAVRGAVNFIMTNKVQRMFNWQGRSMWKTKDNMVKSSF